MNLGDYIKQKRQELKLTQAELGKLLHITPQGLSNYENGKSKIPLSLVLDLCLYLKININDFFIMSSSLENDTSNFSKYNFTYVHKNIAYFREKNKLTLKEVSKSIGITIQRLSDFELNKTSPSIEEFIDIAKFYNVPFSTFFLEKEDDQVSVQLCKKSTKRPLSNYFYAGFAVFLLLMCSIAITLPFVLPKSTQIINNIKTPTLNKVLIKESATSPNNISTLTLNKEYYLFIYLDNSNDAKISSIEIDNKTYDRKYFDELSTNRALRVKFSSSSLNLGSNVINFNGLTYLNDNEEKKVEFKETKLCVYVLAPSYPKFEVNTLNVTSSTANGSFACTKDDYFSLKEKSISLCLRKNGQKIKDIVSKNTFFFDNLEPSTEYFLTGEIFSDFFDGTGYRTHILFQESFITSPLVNVTNIKPSYNSISYSLELPDPNEVKLNSITLIDTATKKDIYKSSKLSDDVKNLKSNHAYEFKIEATHLIKNIQKTYIYTANTTNIDKPEITLNTTNITEYSFEIKPLVKYDLDNFNFISAEIYNAKNIKINSYLINSEYFLFDNLLSDSFYDLRYTYSYDLLDGKGKRIETITKKIKTLEYKEPSMLFESLTADDTSIFFSLTTTNEKIAPTYIKAELYKDDILLETTTSTSHKFYNLETNYSHILKIHYSYDLNNGKGEIFKILKRSIITSSDIFIEDLRPLG